jgi:hypothetical protein
MWSGNGERQSNGDAPSHKPNATHARFGGINGTNARRVIGDNFSQAGRTEMQIGSKGFKIIQLGAHM